MAQDPWGVASTSPADKDPWGTASTAPATPAPLTGGGDVPIPAGLQGPPTPLNSPVANKGLGTAIDTLSAVPSTLAGMVTGPYHAFADAPTQQEQQQYGPGINTPLARTSLGVKRLFVDPTLRGIHAGNAARQAGDLGGAITDYAQSVPIVGPLEKSTVEKAQTEGALPATAGLLTNLFGAKVIGKGAQALAAPGETGAAIQDAARSRINGYLGARAKDVATGANPANAVINDVSGIPLSRGSLVKSLDAAGPRVGQKLSNVVTAADTNWLAPKITSASVAPSIDGPIAAHESTVTGFGGTGVTPSLQQLKDTLPVAAPGTSAPIYGPNAPQVIAPTDLWGHIQNLDDNTKFSGDPQIEGVNEVRRDIRGGLRQQLETADPKIKPLSQRYADIMAARNVLGRKLETNTGLSLNPYHALARSLNAAPVQIGLGKLQNVLGGVVSTAGRILNPTAQAGDIGEAATVGALGGNTQVVNNNNGPSENEIQDGADSGEQESASPNLEDQHVNDTTTPDTHNFSVSGWLAANPGGDPDAARDNATQLGYTVVN